VAPRADKLEKAVGRKPLLEVNTISEFDISAISYTHSLTEIIVAYFIDILNIFWNYEASNPTK
jgi:hypothetical protein